MGEEKEEQSKKKVLEKVGKLVRLAQDDDNEESRNAAIQVVRLMKEHELVVLPVSELERVQKMVQGQAELAKKFENEGTTRMLIAAAAGFFAAKKGLL